jgi:predicted transcriptional regulator
MVKDKNIGQKVICLYQQGYSRRAIQDKLEVSEALVSHYLTKAGYRARSAPITNEQIDYIEDSYCSGLSIIQIANNLGLSQYAVQSKLKQRGYDLNDKVTEKEKEYIQSLWGKGYTLNEIMRETGRGWQTVKNHIVGK